MTDHRAIRIGGIRSDRPEPLRLACKLCKGKPMPKDPSLVRVHNECLDKLTQRAGDMLDLHVENAAPEHDTIAIDVCESEKGEGAKSFTITVSRDEEQRVHVCVTDHVEHEDNHYVLGEEGYASSPSR